MQKMEVISMTRLEKIRAMHAGEVAKLLITHNALDEKDHGEHFCKGDCEWAQNLCLEDLSDDKDCIACCVKWLNEEVNDGN